VTVHALPLPTPFAVGRVNCYLVDDEPLTLVDTGPNSGTSLTALEAALAEHGRRVEDLERIVITHQHMDHFGLLAILADRSGAEVCALDRLAPWLARFGDSAEEEDAFAEAIMLRHGIPDDMVMVLRALSRQYRAWGATATVTTGLVDGGTLGFAGREWRIHHRPGHSPSDTVFHDERSGELVAGDHLIKHISSKPLIARPLDGGGDTERPNALLAYIA
jgi:glyoxylase-like metal-dependent hydrolase (beta-lactamase superfamily II)